jgi:hypothetical protein
MASSTNPAATMRVPPIMYGRGLPFDASAPNRPASTSITMLSGKVADPAARADQPATVWRNITRNRIAPDRPA